MHDASRYRGPIVRVAYIIATRALKKISSLIIIVSWFVYYRFRESYRPRGFADYLPRSYLRCAL